jgi:hypothetical protein
MSNARSLGIWMDHSVANLIEYSTEVMKTKTIESTFTPLVKKDSLEKSENLMHNKEQHQQADFYKTLGETIKDYEEVLLFGPTDAKTELYNLLKADHHFDKIRITVMTTDKMSEPQQHAFVKKHFSDHYFIS